MAFSLFNKKGNEPPKPASVARGPARPKSPTSATTPEAGPPWPDGLEAHSRGDTASKIDRIEAEINGAELQYVPSDSLGQRKLAKPAIEHGFAGSAKTKPAMAANPLPATPAPARKRGTNSVMMMEVQESPFEAAPALEEAAILYANRQDAAAQGALEEAAETEGIPPQAARQAWLMLFDLFENQGRRAEFEAAALEFAVRFETSPPAFNDRSLVKSVTTQAGNAPVVAFSGKLDAGAAKQFENLRVVAARSPALRLDFSKIDTIAVDGSVQMRAGLAALVKSGREISYIGGEHLIALLTRQIEVGRSDLPETFWHLLLDLYQAHNMQVEFEETALGYCITYEVSPPSWVDPPKKTPLPSNSQAPITEQLPDDAFYIKGEIEGSAEPALKEVGDFAAERETVVIDVFHVKRMDFIAAGTLLNLVSALKATGKQVEIRSPSPLLANLFVTMGFTAYCKLVRRKP